MEFAKRIERLEDDVSDLRDDSSLVKAQIPHLATKADLAEMKAALVMWIVGTMLAAAGLAFAIARFSSPPQQPQAAPQVIVIPSAAQTPQPPEQKKR